MASSGIPSSSVIKNSPANTRHTDSISGSGRSLEEGQPTPVFLPGEPHGWRSLVGYSPWGYEEWTQLRDSMDVNKRIEKIRRWSPENLQNNIKGAGKPTATKSFPAQNVKSGAGLGSGGGGSCPKPKLMNMFFFSIATFKIFFYQRPLLI